MDVGAVVSRRSVVCCLSSSVIASRVRPSARRRRPTAAREVDRRGVSASATCERPAARPFAVRGRHGMAADGIISKRRQRCAGTRMLTTRPARMRVAENARHAACAIGTAALPAAMTRSGPSGSCVGRGQRTSRRGGGIDGAKRGADDAEEVVPKSVEGTSQCVCLGSDQAERPVTTSNFFRRELTNWWSVFL